ncbi:MAG TPA: hypothetical protein VJ914_16420 [Pseudonocardiaceae bacterium]|nr:hypothetical protein [Pseudonocardiaceae bacterium]
MIRRFLLVFLGAAALFLVPWTVYLANTLPGRFDTGQWNVAWVGFDTALGCCFALACWLGWRRHRAAVPMLAATATLLCCDAWFDVLLDWASPDRWTSVAMAVGAELPIAGLLLWRARTLLVAPHPRALTVRDIELRTDPRYQRVLRALGELRRADTATLAAEVALPAGEIDAMLGELRTAGYVLRRGGRWQQAWMSTALPNPRDFEGAQRARVEEFVNAKFDHELHLLDWAARHRDEFGDWGKGHRATMRLSAAELAAFDAEYDELIARYSLRHRSSPADREVAIRFYAFPNPSESVLPAVGA